MKKRIVKRLLSVVSCIVLMVAILFSVVKISGLSDNATTHGLSSYPSTEELVTDLTSEGDDLSSSFNLSQYYPLINENQLTSQLCWAYSSTKVLESSLMVQSGEYFNFSELGIAYLGYNGANFIADEAGDFQTFVDIMQNEGLVLENDFSNENITDFKGLTESSHVERYREYVESVKISEFSDTVLPTYLTDSSTYNELYKRDNFDKDSDFIKLIKSYIQTYGGLFGGLKQGTVRNSTEYNSDLAFYSEDIDYEGQSDTGSYFPKGSSQGIGHAVCLIGWDDRYGFLALNSWGSERAFERQFYIPYNFSNSAIRDIFYGDLAGFIVSDEYKSGQVRLHSSSADGFTSKGGGVTLNAQDVGLQSLKNVFSYNDNIQLQFAFDESIVPQAVEISVYKGKVDVSYRFMLDFVDNGGTTVLQVTTPEGFYQDNNFFCGGTYVIRFYNDGSLIGVKDFAIYTGLEVSQMMLVDSTDVTDNKITTYMHNTFASSTDSVTYYMKSGTTYEIQILSTYINPSRTHSLTAKDFKASLYKLKDNELTEENSLDYTSVVGNQYYSANLGYLIVPTKTLKSYENYLLELDFTLTSDIYSACTKTIHLKFYITSRSSLVSNYDDTTNIHYVLDGGENSTKNVDRLPNYNAGYDPNMTDIKLYNPTGKPNYNFTGWFDNKECSGSPIETLTASYVAEHPGPLVLYAKWEPKDEKYYKDTNTLEIDGESTIVYGESLSFSYNFEALDALFGEDETNTNRYKIFYIVYLNDGVVRGQDGTINVTKEAKTQQIRFTLSRSELYASEGHRVELVLRILLNNTYNIIQSLEQTVVVQPKPVGVTYQNMSTTYDGNQHQPSVEDVTVTDHFEEDLQLAALLRGTILPRDAGTYQYELSIGNTNFTFAQNNDKYFDYVIGKKEISLEWQTDQNLSGFPLFVYQYDGNVKMPQPVKHGLVEGDTLELFYQNQNTIGCQNAGTYELNLTDDEFRNYSISDSSVRRCYVQITPVRITISLESIVERVQTAPSYRKKISYQIVDGQIYGGGVQLSITSEGLNSTQSGVYPITCTSEDSNYVVTTLNNNVATYTLTGYYFVYYTLPDGTTYTERVEEGAQAKGVPESVFKAPWLSTVNYSNSLVNETGADLYVKVTITSYVWLVVSVAIVVAFVVIYLIVSRKARRNKVK